MKDRIKVEVISGYHTAKVGEVGYVDGYCRDGLGVPCAIVIIGERIEVLPVYYIKVLR